MSDKILPLPLAAIRSSRVRGDLDGLVSRKREIEEEVRSLVGDEDQEGTLLFELKQISSDLISLFLKHDLEKVKMPDGTSVTKSSTTRRVIIPEKLLEHKVSMSVIEACTVETKSEPFVRVTYPKVKAKK